MKKLMKTKEHKSLAKKIAKAEYILQTSQDKKAIRQAKMDIMELSGHADSLEDMMIIDELVQGYLAEWFDK